METAGCIRTGVGLLCCTLLLASSVAANAQERDAPARIDANLLVVGGTESGCAAAVQAARMGVKGIVLVNDIEWLGGQFSAEGLGAVDENRAHDYNGKTPIPRSGLFREIIDAIEARNAKLYGGVKRPGHTRVITTARPVVAESVFRDLLAPYEDSGQISRYSNYQIRTVGVEGDRVVGVVFESTETGRTLSVRARLTIDASDWGDVIRGSGAAYDFGIDARNELLEPSAPESSQPRTDMNPITWCMILEEQSRESLIPKPPGYDPTSFTKGTWSWIKEDFAYTTRRLVDGHGFAEINHPDVLLICNPNTDYPLDQHPESVAEALEATERGASRKNIVELNPQQRQIIFNDAKNRSLQYLFYLQSSFPRFRKMALSDEFGTADRLPPKPYIRESLRLVAQHIVTEQEVQGIGGRSNYAATMYPDAVFCWQFELDFHPTKKNWLSDAGSSGPWDPVFRGKRGFGNGGTGRAVFPLRGFVPIRVDGLLGAQKHLGYTSIVSSSCRLHDQSVAAGQACGAIAAVSLKREFRPREMALNAAALADVWSGLLETRPGVPMAIWPFGDVDPYDSGFIAIQQLALRRLLPLEANQTDFRPEAPADAQWLQAVWARLDAARYDRPAESILPPQTRRAAAIAIWQAIAAQPPRWPHRKTPHDADGDSIPDSSDPLPWTPGRVSWRIPPDSDGIPPAATDDAMPFRRVNFCGMRAESVQGFVADHGLVYDETRGFGWKRDLSSSNRRREQTAVLADTFIFTRTHDTWECDVPNDRYRVTVCVGDAGHDQKGQNVTIEGKTLFRDHDTSRGEFAEGTVEVNVQDGRLTVEIGRPDGTTNTCLNWLQFTPME